MTLGGVEHNCGTCIMTLSTIVRSLATIDLHCEIQATSPTGTQWLITFIRRILVQSVVSIPCKTTTTNEQFRVFLGVYSVWTTRIKKTNFPESCFYLQFGSLWVRVYKTQVNKIPNNAYYIPGNRLIGSISAQLLSRLCSQRKKGQPRRTLSELH